MKATKLYFQPEVKQQVLEILAPIKNPELWKSLSLPFAPQPSAVVRLDAPTGCGKTALANYMARQLKQTPVHLDFSKVASTELGKTEAAIASSFDAMHKGELTTLILEECEGLLWSRDMVDEDTTYHLNFVNEVLRQIDALLARPKPTLILMTTNRPDLLDAAIESRITDVIHMGIPKGEQAMNIWKSKLPQNVRDIITEDELRELVALDLAPRQIEQGILRVCRKALVQQRTPTPADFLI